MTNVEKRARSHIDDIPRAEIKAVAKGKSGRIYARAGVSFPPNRLAMEVMTRKSIMRDVAWFGDELDGEIEFFDVQPERRNRLG